MTIASIFINIFRNIYVNLRFKLNSKPWLRNFIYKLYDSIRTIEFKIKLLIFKELPNKDYIIYVNPEKIIYEKDLRANNWRLFLKFIKPLLNPRFNDLIQIIDGNWDLKENLKLFRENIKFKSYYQHFINNIDWKETPYYKREAKRYLEGKVRIEYKSAEDLNLKFKYHDKLYVKIKREGLKTQREIIELEGFIINYGRGAIFRKTDDDITVGIGRNGEIIFFDGRHRLNIAQLLKIKKIPVRVLVIHPELFSNLKSKPHKLNNI